MFPKIKEDNTGALIKWYRHKLTHINITLNLILENKTITKVIKYMQEFYKSFTIRMT